MTSPLTKEVLEGEGAGKKKCNNKKKNKKFQTNEKINYFVDLALFKT
jgi:hypothetical protein